MEKIASFQYNYVICGAGGYYSIGYKDIMDLPNVTYYSSYADNVHSKICKLLIRLCFSKKINKIINTPFASIVFPLIYRPVFENNEPLCFIFFGNTQYVYQTPFLSYLRSKYPNVKLVLYLQDLISRNPELKFESCKQLFDLILSYDKGDAHKYGLRFHPTPMSYVNIERDPMLEESDIYFCGYAKTRYPLIHKLYQEFTNLGLKCDFHVVKIPDGETRIEGIQYEDNTLSYEQNIQHILSAKAILEIMQDGADGFTPRVWESIVYDKHLLTNNECVFDSEFYDERYIHNINTPDIERIIKTTVLYSEKQKKQLSPVHLLKYIDALLSC